MYLSLHSASAPLLFTDGLSSIRFSLSLTLSPPLSERFLSLCARLTSYRICLMHGTSSLCVSSSSAFTRCFSTLCAYYFLFSAFLLAALLDFTPHAYFSFAYSASRFSVGLRFLSTLLRSSSALTFLLRLLAGVGFFCVVSVSLFLIVGSLATLRPLCGLFLSYNSVGTTGASLLGRRLWYLRLCHVSGCLPARPGSGSRPVSSGSAPFYGAPLHLWVGLH